MRFSSKRKSKSLARPERVAKARGRRRVGGGARDHAEPRAVWLLAKGTALVRVADRGVRLSC